MKILILGCDGYIGNAITQRLLVKGHVITGVDNFLRREWIEKDMRSISAIDILTMPVKTKLFKELGQFNFRYCDIASNPGGIRNIINVEKPDTIINLAHIPSGPYSQISRPYAEKTLINNYIGTNNILYISQMIITKIGLVDMVRVIMLVM